MFWRICSVIFSWGLISEFPLEFYRNPYNLLEYPRIPQNTKRIPKDSQEIPKRIPRISSYPRLVCVEIIIRDCSISGAPSVGPILYLQRVFLRLYEADTEEMRADCFTNSHGPEKWALKSLRHAQTCLMTCSRFQKCRDWFVDRGELFDNQGACQVSLT